MYKDLTFDAILKRMLEKVAAKYDKREGSVIWDALAPASVEFQNFYVILQGVLMEMFADTATRKFLIKHCAERGISPKQATPATVTGVFTPSTVEIPIGARFSHEDYNYQVTQRISDGVYYLRCETEGAAVNAVTGQLIPIDYIPGLQTAKITEVTILGEDEEDTETLRARYFSSINSEAFGGNKMDYKQKILSMEGVGGVKVYSGAEWNGGGTVKCVIVDSDHGIPSEELVDKIQSEIDPETIAPDGFLSDETDYAVGSGTGEGWAPIGHFVTIVGAYRTVVNIETTLVYKSGHTWDSVKSDVKRVVDDYLHELNEHWDDEEVDTIRVRISQMESRILNVSGVLDIRDTTINGKAENLEVDKDSLVLRGTINGDS